MKLHWYIPFRGDTRSFCGKTEDQTRLTNEPIKVTCVACLKQMEEQGVYKTTQGN